MTIQEAIKSGKPIRRAHKSFGPEFGKIVYSGAKDAALFEYGKVQMPLIIEDILADDWETQRTPRQLRLYRLKGRKGTWTEHEPPSTALSKYDSMLVIEVLE